MYIPKVGSPLLLTIYTRHGFSELVLALEIKRIKIHFPACDRSFMNMGGIKFMFDWSRNTTDDQKIAEGAEYERYFQTVLSILDDHFQ